MIKRPNSFSLVCLLVLLGVCPPASLAAQGSSQSPTAGFRAYIADPNSSGISGRATAVPDLKPEPIETEVSLPSGLTATLRAGPSPQSAPNIGVSGFASTDKVQRGRSVQVAVVMDIPPGYHVNSNRPLESFLVATQLKVEVPGGVRAGAVTYPRALLRKFSFSNDKLSVYEGRAVLRFNVTVTANFGAGSMELKSKLRYQSCSDALCFPPQMREVKVEIPVVAANEPVKRINNNYFGRGR